MKVMNKRRNNLRKNSKKVDIVEVSYEFASRIVMLVRALPEEITSFELGKELIRSGTSIVANIEEAQVSLSREDFTFKMNDALKEAAKTCLWLRLIRDLKLIEFTEDLENLFEESVGVKKLLAIIVENSRKK